MTFKLGRPDCVIKPRARCCTLRMHLWSLPKSWEVEKLTSFLELFAHFPNALADATFTGGDHHSVKKTLVLYFNMFASQFILPILAFTGLAAFASPDEIQKHAADVSNVLDIVSTLQESTSSILPQLNALVSNGQANTATVTPLINQLVALLNTAGTSFNSLGPVDASTGGTQEDVAEAFFPILSEIAVTLAAVELAVPGLAPLLAALGIDDFALNQVLLGLDIVLHGVVRLVAVFLPLSSLSVLWDCKWHTHSRLQMQSLNKFLFLSSFCGDFEIGYR
ncbi:hypothetical protein CPB84DRAFT_1455027 [Gymnopilus junonius]|uniref:Uncharacterized protein n=1 Tax=Gymnopilus junonius TaxID=109634 RepID=A0A9P5TLE1_GYMJU|nr:hypothetical protein CPB84DRAFT_1455027 [Gymnopilus junonius]